MEYRRVGRMVTGLGLLVAGAGALVACSGGVAQADYDSLQAQLSAEQQKAQTYQTQLSSKTQETTTLQQQVADKEKAVADLEQELADAVASAGELAGVTPLIYTKQQPLPPPRPTPTPAPPGYVPPPPATPDAATVDAVFPFTFYIEHLTGHQTTTVTQYPSCVPNSQFQRGAHLVWRFEVFDTSTGRRLTSLDENTTIKVVLPHGEEKTARYARRGGTGPWTWVAAWTVPDDYPLGVLDYQIVVTKGDRTGTFDQDDIAVVNLERGTDSRVQIVQ